MNYHQACWLYTVYKDIFCNREINGQGLNLFVAPNDTNSLFTHQQRFYEAGCHCKSSRATDFQVWVAIGSEPGFISLDDYLR